MKFWNGCNWLWKVFFCFLFLFLILKLVLLDMTSELDIFVIFLLFSRFQILKLFSKCRTCLFRFVPIFNFFVFFRFIFFLVLNIFLCSFCLYIAFWGFFVFWFDFFFYIYFFYLYAMIPRSSNVSQKHDPAGRRRGPNSQNDGRPWVRLSVSRQVADRMAEKGERKKFWKI